MKQLVNKMAFSLSIFVLFFATLTPVSANAQDSTNQSEGSIDTTIKLDPSYQHAPFDGWGTALVWFANVTGGWPDDIRNQLADELFDESGLNLNIARYNIGGEDAPETEPYMRLGAAVPGYWNRPAEFAPPEDGQEQENWWDPDNPEHWDWDKDANQQWWLEAAKSRGADTFEAFSNSAPYFMTNSGYTSGNTNSTEDNLREDKYDEFATYLTRVVEHFEEEKGITFNTLSPVNEPNTDYWGAQGRQEGSHWSPDSQAKIINEVSDKLNDLGLNTDIAAMDETNPQKFRQNWQAYNQATRDNVGQMNVHTYWPEERGAVRDIAKGEDKRLWMSEVDLGPSGIPQDFDNIEPGLALSERITSDIMTLEPKAWVLWQAIEDQVNMNADNENMNWGLIHVDFDPEDFDGLEYYKNKKYYTMANYTKFIRPGHQVINTNNENTLAAINKKDQQAVVVYTNQSESEENIALDLSGFGVIDQSASAVPYATTAEKNVEQGEAIDIDSKTLQTTVEPKSVTTFVVSGVAGVNDEESFLQEDKRFKIENKNSEKVLDLNGQDLVQNTSEKDKASQEWQLDKVTDDYTSSEEYHIVHAATNEVLTSNDGNVIASANENTDAQKWILSTSGKKDYTFINKATGTLLEVGGQSTAEGASVGVWEANAGAHQEWTIMESGITKLENITTWTTIGNSPDLPETVLAYYGDGEQSEVSVEWDAITSEQYSQEGEFEVEGSVEGTDLQATATVYVSSIEQLKATKLKTVKGVAPSLPNTIKAVLSNDEEMDVTVDWEQVETDDYADYGKFTITGEVENTDQQALATIQVVESGLENLALRDSSVASASFTGQWDSVDHVNDGVYSDERWTNWVPNEWRETDWVEIDFQNDQVISKVDFTFYDDEDGTRPPKSLYLEYWDGDDWIKIENSDTTVEEEDEISIEFEEITTSKVRTQLTAMEETCIAIVEMEVYGLGETPVIGDDASLDSILINDQNLEGFQSDQYSYQIELDHGETLPTISAMTADIFATYQIEMPDTIPGVATITVLAENQEDQKTYSISITEKEKEPEEPEEPEEPTDPSDPEDPGDNTQQEITLSSANEVQYFDVVAGQLYTIKGTNSSIKMPSDLPEGTKLAIYKNDVKDDQWQVAGDSFTFKFDFAKGADKPQESYLLTLGLDETIAGDKDIYYFDEENEQWIAQHATKDQGATLSVEVNHFSSYAVLTENKEDAKEEESEDNPSSDADSGKDNNDSSNNLPETATNQFNLLLVGIVLLLIGIGVWLFRRKLN
ncbi:glycoside hydrolase [Gracilibacillus massiliensis]|uniref:glycoside hydrolase n=1 Tax=Gracilibacillus massiliensis TaxID=1564956 RepID=UPI00071DE07F|nr:glycoside hydrolase [Gracilibacillus massiliensis]